MMRVARGPTPQFYLGGNKKAVPSDGISDEERKAFGIERFVAALRMPKRGALGLIERGADLAVLGLKLDSDEYAMWNKVYG